MRIDIVSHRTTQPPHCAEMLEGEHAAVRAEELSLGLGSGHRGIRVFGHPIHFIVNKYLLNFSIYSSPAKLGWFMVLETASTVRDGLCSNEGGSRSKRGVLSSSFTDFK